MKATFFQISNEKNMVILFSFNFEDPFFLKIFEKSHFLKDIARVISIRSISGISFYYWLFEYYLSALKADNNIFDPIFVDFYDITPFKIFEKC